VDLAFPKKITLMVHLVQPVLVACRDILVINPVNIGTIGVGVCIPGVIACPPLVSKFQ
jgi:hypothetical protein